MVSIFKKIIDGELPAEKVFENERFIAIKDISPKAPVHILIIPKQEIYDLQSVKVEDLALIGEAVKIAQDLAKENGIEKGYRFVVNNGPLAGQTVFHLHFHLLGGHQLGSMG